jgi:hypothetical protein
MRPCLKKKQLNFNKKYSQVCRGQWTLSSDGESGNNVFWKTDVTEILLNEVRLRKISISCFLTYAESRKKLKYRGTITEDEGFMGRLVERVIECEYDQSKL